jgi:hypothetical protein
LFLFVGCSLLARCGVGRRSFLRPQPPSARVADLANRRALWANVSQRYCGMVWLFVASQVDRIVHT